MREPAFAREGSAIDECCNANFTAIRQVDDRSADIARRSCYSALDADVITRTTAATEMLKYVCNAFHAVKIGFANEMGNLAFSQARSEPSEIASYEGICW